MCENRVWAGQLQEATECTPRLNWLSVALFAAQGACSPITQLSATHSKAKLTTLSSTASTQTVPGLRPQLHSCTSSAWTPPPDQVPCPPPPQRAALQSAPTLQAVTVTAACSHTIRATSPPPSDPKQRSPKLPQVSSPACAAAVALLGRQCGKVLPSSDARTERLQGAAAAGGEVRGGAEREGRRIVSLQTPCDKVLTSSAAGTRGQHAVAERGLGVRGGVCVCVCGGGSG